MSRYRKKPVVIEARQLDMWNAVELAEWSGHPNPHNASVFESLDDDNDRWAGIQIITLEGTMIASPVDWIIKGVADEFYPCRADIFEVTYEPLPPFDALLIEETEGQRP